jgi:hypothetical protein
MPTESDEVIAHLLAILSRQISFCSTQTRNFRFARCDGNNNGSFYRNALYHWKPIAIRS